ncbi:MAG: phosphatidate cytidylyltransferase [Sphaerochaetaceae bacterium]
MTKNLIQRIITTSIGIPLVICLLVLLPQFNFLGFSILAFIAAILGTRELERLIIKKNTFFSFLPPLLIVFTYLQLLLDINLPLTDFYLVFLLLIFFSKEIFLGEKDNFKTVISAIGNSLIMVFYPSFLITYVIRILALNSINLPKTSALYFLFMLILVFSNDIFAYIWGMSLGKNSKKLIKVSPHKSLAGFIGGHISSIVISLALVYFFYPEIGYLMGTIMALFTSFTANVGDLVESTLKRSTSVKDSGSIVPGRGGVLDSIDSIIFSTPFFYLFLVLTSL